VFAYGDARFAGSLARTPLQAPIVGAAATPDGRGYWMISADGGVFAFGDARYYGSLSTTALNKKVVGIAPTPDGRGYWLAAADGGVFAFGDATFRGSASGEVPSNDGIVSVATGPGIADHAYGPAGNFFPSISTSAPRTPRIRSSSQTGRLGRARPERPPATPTTMATTLRSTRSHSSTSLATPRRTSGSMWRPPTCGRPTLRSTTR